MEAEEVLGEPVPVPEGGPVVVGVAEDDLCIRCRQDNHNHKVQLWHVERHRRGIDSLRGEGPIHPCSSSLLSFCSFLVVAMGRDVGNSGDRFALGIRRGRKICSEKHVSRLTNSP